MKGIYAFKIKTMGTYDPITKGFRRIGKWYKRGVSDILGIHNGKFLAIEVKTESGRLTEHQKIFLQEVKECGGIAFVARSIKDVESSLGEADASVSQ